MRSSSLPRTLAVLIAALLGACGGVGRRAVGPDPVPDPWAPEKVLRRRVEVSGAGQVVLDDRDGLSPDEAALMAIDQNPRLQAVREDRDIARAEVVAAGILPNPRLDAAADLPTGDDESKVLGYGVGLSWNVTPLLSRGARVDAAEKSRDAVDLEVAWKEWQVAQAARLHTIRCIYLSRRLEAAREIEERWQQRLAAVARQETAAHLHIASVERMLADARVKRLSIERRLGRERIALNETIGLDARSKLRVDDAWTPSTTDPETEERLADLPQRRLDLIALQHAHRSKSEALRAEVLAQFPAIEVGVRATRDVDDDSSTGVMVSIEIPIFDRNQAKTARQRALQDKVEAEYDARVAEARAQVLGAGREIAAARRQLEAAEHAREASAELARSARGEGGGALGPVVLSDLERRATAARLRALAIEQSLAELRVALVTSSGRY